MTSEHQVVQDVDSKGEYCPMPVVRLRLAIDEVKAGQVVRLLATDPGAKKDIPAWSEMTGHKLLKMTEDKGLLVFLVQKV